MTRKHVPLDMRAGQRVVIHDGMTASEIVSGVIKALRKADATVRKRITTRLSGAVSHGGLVPCSGGSTPRYSKESIHSWVCRDYPEAADHVSYDAPENVTVQLRGESADVAPLGELCSASMPDTLEGSAVLIRELRRENAELKKALSEPKKALRQQKSAYGRKGGRGNTA